MRPAADRLLLIAALSTAPGILSAQTLRLGVSIGALTSTALVKDSVVFAVSVAPRPAPGFAFWAETRLNPRYRLSAGLHTAWSRLQRTENDSTVSVVPLATWTPTVTLDRALLEGLGVYASAGAVLYRADRTSANLFRRGSSPRPVFGAGVRYDRPLAGGLVLTGRLGYDFHRFSTPSLQEMGFRGERPVHRIGLSVGVSRGL